MKKQLASSKPQDIKETLLLENKEPETKVGDKLVTVGWFLLLFGGLAFMLPEQMRPLLQWSIAGVTLQMFVGVAATVVALNFLLKD